METRALAAAAVFGGAARRDMDHARACECACERGCERARCPSRGRGAPPQTQHFLPAGCWPKSSRRQGTQPLGIAGSAAGAGEDGEDTAGCEGETPDGAAEGDGSSMVVVVIPMPSPEFSEQQQSIAKVEPEPQLSPQMYVSEVATIAL